MRANLLSASIFVLAGLCAAAPAVRAGDEFCGRPSGKADELLATISKAEGVKEIHRGPEYLAFQDGASQTVFTFTQAAQGPAHPTAVCRRPVKDGDNLILQMVIVCNGETEACQRLESDFKLLNAKMEAAIRNEAGEAAPKK
jgi:hypothetical protein